ncbi:MAG: diadenylate cyclase CdaA [Paludibacteraceae bacterium]|nr:diadenylate cyclase CdaA [Paludibacteraceae bacterium]
MGELQIKDVIDIVVVALLLYKTYKMLKGTSVIRVFVGILIFVLIWLLVTFVFQMELLGAIMDKIMNVGVIAIIVLFREEIRRSLSILGSRHNFIMRQFEKLIPSMKTKTDNDDIAKIVEACSNMSKEKVGALIVIENKSDLSDIVKTGEVFTADINSRLIENIFFKNSPLHDGAMIISGDKIIAAACILPVTKNMSVPKELGLRHRAALGVSEVTDAITIVVSEETGNISITKSGKFHLHLSPKDLEIQLAYNKSDNDKSK